MAGLVLHLGKQYGFALERGRAGDPVALGQHADDFRMSMLRNLAHQGLAIGLGHPVFGLDAYAFIDAFLKKPFSRSEEHTSDLQSLIRISYAVFCLQKKKKI